MGEFQVGSGLSPEAVALAQAVQCDPTAQSDQTIFLKNLFFAWELKAHSDQTLYLQIFFHGNLEPE